MASPYSDSSSQSSLTENSSLESLSRESSNEDADSESTAQEELALESEFYDDNGDKEPEYGILHYSSPHSFVDHSSEHEVYNDRSENSSSPDTDTDTDNISYVMQRPAYKRPRIDVPQRPEIEVQPADAQTVFNEEFETNNEIESDYDGDFVQYENDELSNLSSENNISEPCHTDSSSDPNSSQSDSDTETSDGAITDASAMPAFQGSTVTRSNFEATFLAISKKHKLSKSTKHDLLKFFNLISPNPNLPTSNYSFDQDIWKAIDVNFEKYEFCPGCNHLLHLKTRICENRDCKYFNGIPTTEPTELFFIIPVAVQLKRILEENWTSIQKYKSDHSHNDGKLRDICCGDLYRQQAGCDDPTKLLSLLFHIDGAPAVKSKTLSLWPIQCILVELPLTTRYSFKNVLFCGLWCGTKKPDLQLFQKYFVDQVQEINESGLNVNVRATTEQVKVTLLNVHGHIADLVAKAPSLNFK